MSNFSASIFAAEIIGNALTWSSFFDKIPKREQIEGFAEK